MRRTVDFVTLEPDFLRFVWFPEANHHLTITPIHMYHRLMTCAIALTRQNVIIPWVSSEEFRVWPGDWLRSKGFISAGFEFYPPRPAAGTFDGEIDYHMVFSHPIPCLKVRSSSYFFFPANERSREIALKCRVQPLTWRCVLNAGSFALHLSTHRTIDIRLHKYT